MRVHVVSDVHGNADALARAGDGADVLLVLGDLVDFVAENERIYSNAVLARGYDQLPGEPISLRRLEARPIATLSIEAQERHERRERVYRDD